MNIVLANWESVSADEPWENTLGMKFVSVPGTEVLFCIWLTRVRDYSTYAALCPKIDSSWAKKTDTYGLTICETPEHPVCNVSWHDAKAFCAWLTEQEQRSEILSSAMHYRLPADAEWSKAVCFTDEVGETPEEKCENQKTAVFPWGRQWPPPSGAGNFGDETLRARALNSIQPRPCISGYDDGFATTSPVGSFPPNRYGLYDLAGNVCEWCEDEHCREKPGYFTPDHQKGRKVLRGGDWTISQPVQLLSGQRFAENPKVRNAYSGFRVVLAHGSL
jgi:formylglycine-generating enzyme required for sulfatase activity